MTMIEQAENTIEGRGGNPCGFGEGKWFSNGIITHSTQNYNRAKTMFEKHTSVFIFIQTFVVCCMSDLKTLGRAPVDAKKPDDIDIMQLP